MGRADHFGPLPCLSAISFPNSSGESTRLCASRAMLALIVGSARPAFTSRLRRSMIAGGVSFGAPKPTHALDLYPRHEVGHDWNVRQHVKSGCSGHRRRALPALMCTVDDDVTSNITCTDQPRDRSARAPSRGKAHEHVDASYEIRTARRRHGGSIRCRLLILPGLALA